MRIGYDKDYDLCMCAENEPEYDSMNNIYKDIFGIDLSTDYYHDVGIVLAHSHETKLIKIIEKMRDDKIERLLQIRNEDKYVRFAARVMIELWG